jgi:2-methylcitrate dehydratase
MSTSDGGHAVDEGTVQKTSQTWVSELAELAADLYHGEIPVQVLQRAMIQTMDTIACAAGALGATAPKAVGAVIPHDPGQEGCSLFFESRKARPEDAVLYNGALVRYLDYNDGYLRQGPGGHPSDNVPVAVAMAERQRSSGADFLRSVVVGYEIFWRLRQGVFRAPGASRSLDGVSASGMVAACISGLLMGLDVASLSNAMAIAGSQGYTLPQVRRGRISMVKAIANAVVARHGILAAQLAAEGMTGPAEIFEGDGGLLEALGVEPTEAVRAMLFGPVGPWRITEVSIKPYPAIGTSQAAITAAVRIKETVDFSVEDIGSVTIRLPDGIAAREQQNPERRLPTSRESADHSVPFLVACALETGDVQPNSFDRDWDSLESSLPLLARIQILPDADLVADGDFTYPAVVNVSLKDGRLFSEGVTDTPGSPLDPWGQDEVGGKLVRLAAGQIPPAAAVRLIAAVSGLATAPSLQDLSGALTESMSEFP